MAAFCGCCGAEIADPAETCPVCGMPRHGMMPLGAPLGLAEDNGPSCCVEQPSPGEQGR